MTSELDILRRDSSVVAALRTFRTYFWSPKTMAWTARLGVWNLHLATINRGAKIADPDGGLYRCDSCGAQALFYSSAEQHLHGRVLPSRRLWDSPGVLETLPPDEWRWEIPIGSQIVFAGSDCGGRWVRVSPALN